MISLERGPKRLRANILQAEHESFSFSISTRQISDDFPAGQHPGPLHFAHGVLASSPFVSVLDPGCARPSFEGFGLSEVSDVFWVPVKQPREVTMLEILQSMNQ